MDWKAGDIVLFQSYGPSWLDQQKTKLVQNATYGPYVHVAILMGSDGTTIQAGGNGIDASKIDSKTPCTVVSIRDFAKNPPLDEGRISRALASIASMKGTPYSWLDIVDQGVRLLPRSIPWWYVKQSDRFDCSNLAMFFLSNAGMEIPRVFSYPYDCSPNDIAEFFMLLPLRHQVWK
jgi:hypothetical protein